MRWRAVAFALAIITASLAYSIYIPPAHAALTHHFRSGNVSDDGEITEAATNRGNLEGGSGAVCGEFRTDDGESSKLYDIKQAITYASGTWQVIIDNSRDDTAAALRIVVTNNVGAELRNIHDFGVVTIGTAGDDTHTANGVPEQTLTASERLAVILVNQNDGNQIRIGIDNVNASCNSRLVSPDEPAPACDAITVVTADPAGEEFFTETVEPDGIPFTTQVNVSASFQDGTTPALSVTNDGTATCDVTLRLMSAPGIGRSLKFNTTNIAPWPADVSKEVPLDPSSVTVCASVSSGGTCDIWLWADYENALAGQSVVDVRVETA